MATIDEGLAQRIRETLFELADFAEISERKMFGSLVCMVNGYMTCGAGDEGMMLRVGADRYVDALKHPHAEEMDFTGRPITGFLYITAQGTETDEDLTYWLNLSLGFILAQPPK